MLLTGLYEHHWRVGLGSRTAHIIACVSGAHAGAARDLV
jgi:hypothetical protein